MNAAHNNHRIVVEMLLLEGADVNARNQVFFFFLFFNT